MNRFIPRGLLAPRGTQGGRAGRLALAVLAGLLALSLASCRQDATLATTRTSKVLVLGQDSYPMTCPCGLTFVPGFLAPHKFTSIATMDNRLATPTLGQLAAYDAVLVWTDGPALDPIALGDVLANYVDGGGGVVLATFGFASGWNIQGRFTAPGYAPLGIGGTMGPGSLATPLVLHQITQGVTSMTANFRDNAPVRSGGTLLATWADGANAVAVNLANNVVGITAFPEDNAMTGDYARLFANALHWVAAH